jgi:hypothetical protein
MLSENSEPDAQTLFSSQTVFTPAARQPRIEDHLGPGFDSFDTAAHRIDDAGTVCATDMRQADRNSRHSMEDEEIEVVESSGLQLHPHLARSRLGRGTISEQKIVSSAVFFEV